MVAILTGMADALVSGTDEAMVYDSLLACGKVQNFQQVCQGPSEGLKLGGAVFLFSVCLYGVDCTFVDSRVDMCVYTHTHNMYGRIYI